jgi:hypothetical protein
MRTLPLAAALVVLSTTWANATPRIITCDGAYRGERIGYCHLMDHELNPILGEKEVPEPVGLEKITKAGCEMYERCVIRAKVTDRGKVDGYQNWTVLKVYWARRQR